MEKAALKPNQQIVIDLVKVKKNNEKSEIASSIIQLDGEGDMDSEDAIFTFNSEYGEEEIVNSLTGIFPEKLSKLVSRVVVRPFNQG